MHYDYYIGIVCPNNYRPLQLEMSFMSHFKVNQLFFMHENADAKKKLRLNYQCLLANQGLITLLKYCIAKNMEKKRERKKRSE